MPVWGAIVSEKTHGCGRSINYTKMLGLKIWKIFLKTYLDFTKIWLLINKLLVVNI